jgi:hypothetical protein
MMQLELPADFDRLAPRNASGRGAGDNRGVSLKKGPLAGRTDAGRPGLPLKGQRILEV